MLVNEMNRLHHLDNKMQYTFVTKTLNSRKDLLHSGEIGTNPKNLEYVKEYYGYSNKKDV